MKTNYWHSLEHGCFYHIYNRAVGNDHLFRDDSDYRFFLKKYKNLLHPYCHTYAYALMPNHFHLIIKVKEHSEVKETIEKEETRAAEKYTDDDYTINDFLLDQLRRMMSAIPLRYNNKYNRKGPLFQPKVKRVFIDPDHRLQYLICYLHHNAIHHHQRTRLGQWKYDSFRAIMLDKNTLIARESVIEVFGDIEQFVDYHKVFKRQKMVESIDDIIL